MWNWIKDILGVWLFSKYILPWVLLIGLISLYVGHHALWRLVAAIEENPVIILYILGGILGLVLFVVLINLTVKFSEMFLDWLEKKWDALWDRFLGWLREKWNALWHRSK